MTLVYRKVKLHGRSMKAVTDYDLKKTLRRSHAIALATTLTCMAISLVKAYCDWQTLQWPQCTAKIERPAGNLLVNRNSTDIFFYRYVVQEKECFGRVPYTDLLNIKSYDSYKQTVLVRYDANNSARSTVYEPSILNDILITLATVMTYPALIIGSSPEILAVSARRAIQAATVKLQQPAIVQRVKVKDPLKNSIFEWSASPSNLVEPEHHKKLPPLN